MKEVFLAGGVIALVDDQDFELVSQYKWHAEFLGKNGARQCYAKASTKIPGASMYTTISMHRLILQPPTADLHTDHINGCGLDNRRTNLRLATAAENAQNRKKHQSSEYTNPFKGITYHKPTKFWRATVCAKRKFHRAGIWYTPEAAGLAYNYAAKRLHGQFARLNILPMTRDEIIAKELQAAEGRKDGIAKTKARIALWLTDEQDSPKAPRRD